MKKSKQSSHSNKSLKKIRLDQSITLFEDLFDELFYEIFDYLDGCSILYAFSNLNQYFQRLIHSPLLLFKIQDGEEKYLLSNWQIIHTYHRHQILSIYIPFFFLNITNYLPSSSFIFDSSLSHLRVLSISIEEFQFLLVTIAKLISLPYLQTLIIRTYDKSTDLNKVYPILFKLSMLKYLEFSVPTLESSFSLLPAVNNTQSNSIESLHLGHNCTLDDVIKIISYTPNVHHLSFEHNPKDSLTEESYSSDVLSNLTSLSIEMFDKDFSLLTRLFTENKINLKKFKILLRCYDFDFHDAYQWQRFICQNLPQLEKFICYFEYWSNDDTLSLTYPGKIDDFTSKFCIEKQWLMECEIHDEQIIYIIRPDKKRWYDYSESAIDLTKSTRLIICEPADDTPPLETIVKHVLTITQIYHLEIFQNLLNDRLIRVIKLFSQLNSLKVNFRIVNNKAKAITSKEFNVLRSMLKSTNIKKLYLKETHVIDDDSTILLHRLMSDQKTISMSKENAEHCLRKLLRTNHRSLCFLCLRVGTVDDEMIGEFKKMIDDEELLEIYTIERVVDRVYLQWK